MESKLIKCTKPQFRVLTTTHRVHAPGEEQVGEAEVPVQDGVGVQVEQSLHRLAKDAPSWGRKRGEEGWNKEGCKLWYTPKKTR